MKKFVKTAGLLSLLLFCGSSHSVQAQDVEDSVRLENMQELVVKAVRVDKDAPYAVANISKKELQAHSTTGRELPMLLARTPGITAWGENGLGTGTTYMRIRGAAGSQINVTLDGVALNSPEDETVFWANMNSYASLLGNVQVQRGVGTSTNGDGAFGGTIALTTATPSYVPSAEVNYGYGSYNTMNYGAKFSTGLLWDQLIIDGAWHQTQTDGFIHGTRGNSGSFYGGLTWLVNDRLTLRYKNIGNYEHTGQAWNGVTAGDNDLSLMDGTYGASTGIKNYSDLYDRGLGKYNTLYETLAYDANGDFARDANGNYLTTRYQMADGSYWDRTTDNFNQDHNLLSMTWDIDDHWFTTATLHYTYGYGYYDEFRPQNKLKKFGLSNYTASDGSTVKRSDFVRQKGLEQHTYGLVWNTNYKDDRWDVIGGLSYQMFSGNHFGYLTYVSHPELSASLLKNGRYTYYDSDATKNDGTLFLKAAYRLEDEWTAFGDLQYRYVDYSTDGYNDKYLEQADGTLAKHYLDIDEQYHFFNPKAGITWHRDGHTAYFSEAISHREPERNNFTDNGNYPAPKAEWVFDFEGGYNYSGSRFRAGANLYFMYYTNQLVRTGAQSDIGENLTTNIRTSYRAGAELTAGWDITSWLSLEGNAALSTNRILDFDEVVEDWDNGSRTIHYDNSTLSFSPSVLLNGFLDFHWKGLQATWHTNYVSRQYLDNTACKDRSLPAYSLSDLHVAYTLPCHRKLGLREVVFGADLSNIFSGRYAANGWVYSAICDSYGHPADNRYYQIGYIPMAGFTAMGSVTLRF
ncbi:MAG: TonB-dependent receptor plug domain-containing protein [Bacteroidaceae bacterium]|nr:TonB-dependent receptor plug domain-containing protein [Bacteroidaceae bacterium]